MEVIIDVITHACGLCDRSVCLSSSSTALKSPDLEIYYMCRCLGEFDSNREDKTTDSLLCD